MANMPVHIEYFHVRIHLFFIGADMIEDLRYVLSQYLNPERTRLLIGAVSTLYEYNYTSFESPILQLINVLPDVGSEKMLMDTATIIERSMEIVLREHGLTFVSGDLTIKMDILDGLKTLETYDDHEALVDIATDEEDPSQALCEMLALVTNRSWADFAEPLGDVPSSLIERLLSVHEREMGIREALEDDDSDATEIDVCKLRARLKNYLSKSGKDLMAADLVASGYRVGTSIDQLLTAKLDELYSFMPKKPELAAKNLMSIALMSSESISTLKQAINDRLEDLYDDVSFITGVDVALTDEMRKVVAYEQE
jgi:hypothetical protein